VNFIYIYIKMSHSNNPNIPPLSKPSSVRKTTRSRGQTYPRPTDTIKNNIKQYANITNTPTSNSNNTNDSERNSNKSSQRRISKNKFNKFTSPKRKRSESSISHEERVRSAMRSAGHHTHMDLRGSFDDLSLSNNNNNSGDLSPMSILRSGSGCEPPRSSRRVEIDDGSPPFSARSDISNVSNHSSNNDSNVSSFFVQSPNATISPQQQQLLSGGSSNKFSSKSSTIMHISSIPGIVDPLNFNILNSDHKRNNLSSGRRRRFRDSLFEQQHLNKPSANKNLAFTSLRVEGIAAMPSSKSKRPARGNLQNTNNTNHTHSSKKGPIRASKSASSKKRSASYRSKHNNNSSSNNNNNNNNNNNSSSSTNTEQARATSSQEIFRSPRPVPPRTTNKSNNKMNQGDDRYDIMDINTPSSFREQKMSDISMASSGSLSARSLSSNSSIHSVSSINSSTERTFHYKDMIEDEFGIVHNNNNNNHYRVPPLPFHTPSKPVWRGPSPRDDIDDADEFKMSGKKKNHLHINDLNNSIGSLGDDDLNSNANDLYSSKMGEVEDLDKSNESYDGNENNSDNDYINKNNKMMMMQLNSGVNLDNSFDSDSDSTRINNNEVDNNNLKMSSPEERDGDGKKVTPSGRPTPDMEAFDRKKSSPAREKGPQCPPTPVRTPSWAHNSSVGPGTPGGIERRNSLDGTKVLFATNSFDSDFIAFDDDFENLGILGSGAFSKVFKCRSIHDSKLYAIKKSKRQFRSKRDRARYLEEVQTFQLLGPNCPHVLHYHRAWQENGFFYIQSEYCSRGNLKVFFNEIDESVTVPDSAIWGIIVDVCAGLSHIHTHNLVHLDIKPQNIFITNDGTLKIGDFGMVREVGSSEDGHEGDNRYMAPELLESSLKSPAADMFSFGIMMWEIMFNADPPHDGEEWHNFRSDRVPRPNKQRGDKLFSLICKLLASKPSKRPTSRQVLLIPRVQVASQETNSFITSVPRKKKSKRRFPGHLQLGRSDSFIGGSSTGFDPNEIARMREGLCTPKDQPVNRDW
jgi:serine/threonine protein kinase